MPYSGVPDHLTEKMEDCVESVMNDGKTKSEAIAICKSRIVDKDKKDLTLTEREEAIRDKWRLLFDDYTGPTPWLSHIFRDYAVFRFEGDYYRVDYEWASNNSDDIKFDIGNAYKVEHTFSPIRTVMVPSPIRSEGDKNIFTAYAVLFGSPDKRDLHGTYFTKDTNYYLDWFNERPWLYHHGIRPQELRDSGSQRIGTWKEIGQDEIGVFVKGELDLRHKYMDAIRELTDNEVLYPSSGTLEYVMRVGPDGFVEDWPIVEVSSTVAPSEYRQKPVSVAAKRAMELLATSEGGFTMSLPDALNKLLGRRSTDLEEEDQVEDAAPEVEEEAPEGEPETSKVEGMDMEATVKSLIEVVTQLDDAIREQCEQTDAIREVVVELAKDKAASVKSAMSDPDWTNNLYVATRAKESENEVPEEEAENIRAANSEKPREDGSGASPVWDATRVGG